MKLSSYELGFIVEILKWYANVPAGNGSTTEICYDIIYTLEDEIEKILEREEPEKYEKK